MREVIVGIGGGLLISEHPETIELFRWRAYVAGGKSSFTVETSTRSSKFNPDQKQSPKPFAIASSNRGH